MSSTVSSDCGPDPKFGATMSVEGHRDERFSGQFSRPPLRETKHQLRTNPRLSLFHETRTEWTSILPFLSDFRILLGPGPSGTGLPWDTSSQVPSLVGEEDDPSSLDSPNPGLREEGKRK